jgi:hypothetical protein
MRFLAKILFFTPNFLTHYTTTLGQTIYATDNILGIEDAGTLGLLAHEARHMCDEKKLSTPLYVFAYLSPQILALVSLLSLLAIWFSPSWLWCLSALVLLAPIPSVGRMLIERQGYLMSLCVTWWTQGEDVARKQIDWRIQQFTGRPYYFMWPFKKHLHKWFEKELAEKAKHPSRYNALYVIVFDFVNSPKNPRRR